MSTPNCCTLTAADRAKHREHARQRQNNMATLTEAAPSVEEPLDEAGLGPATRTGKEGRRAPFPARQAVRSQQRHQDGLVPPLAMSVVAQRGSVVQAGGAPQQTPGQCRDAVGD